MPREEAVLLLVEDEPLILLSSQAALEDGGYVVVTAASGTEAMTVLEERKDDLFGLITDIRLGLGLNGWELARFARTIKPDLPVIYATGDSASEWSAEGVPRSIVVQKPYASAQIVTAISTLLTEADREGSL
jgi:CheY-like chemotaxis protein